jgi:hypothetical protein
MTLVVDANVAVKWFIQQQGSDDARRVQLSRPIDRAPLTPRDRGQALHQPACINTL